MKQSVVVMVQIETDDPRLNPSRDMVATADKAASIRQAVIENLPNLTRVIALLPVDHAKMLMQLHEAVGDELAREFGGESAFVRPPGDYKPPGAA